MGLKQLLTAGGKDTCHEVEIDGQTLKFYPVRVMAMLRAQSVVSEIARAITGFFDPNAEQYTKRSLMTEQDPESGNLISSSVEEPISPVHAKERLKRRSDGVSAAVDALMGEDNMRKLAILVLDSLRDDETDVDELLASDATVFARLVKETVMANAPQLSPFLSKAAERMAAKLEASPAAGPDEPQADSEQE